MIKKEANLTAIMLVQQLDPTFWHTWENTSPILEAKNGNCKPLLEIIVKRLADSNIEVIECYSIIHNKDKRIAWNQKEMKNIVEDKALHIHVLMKFKKGASLNKLAVAIGVETQYLEKLKSGRYGYDNSLAYLIHSKDDTKHQYSPEEVFTLLGEDYKSIYSRRINTWLKGKATKIAKETSLSIDWLISEILTGNITKNNILLTDEYYTIYGQYKRKINEALDTANEKKALKTIMALENKEFKKTIIFIEGKSGIGKTVFAKNIINIIKKLSTFHSGKIWESCITASSNAFDEYSSQEILLLDDIRGNSFSVSDWLKLLDPYSISPISARYNNKQAVAKLIIITSPHSPRKFFKNVKNSTYEDFDQFYRRFDLYVKLDSNFLLSNVYKKHTVTTEKSTEIKHNYKYRFSIPKIRNDTQIKKLIANKVIRNMNWNKKELSEHTDQSK